MMIKQKTTESKLAQQKIYVQKMAVTENVWTANKTILRKMPVISLYTEVIPNGQ